MSKHLTYVVVSLFLVVIVAAQTAIAAPVTVKLAEGQDPGDPTLSGPPPTTTTTTTTTTTLPTIPRCPQSFAGATSGSRDGYNHWFFDDHDLCPISENGQNHIYCFENPNVQQTFPEKANWEMVTQEMGSSNLRQTCNGVACLCDGSKTCVCDAPMTCTCDGTTCTCDGKTVTCPYFYGADPRHYEGTWDEFAARVTARGAYHTEACYICGCAREIGCFPPGVKITMADGSLHNIEDVRAGDMVRNAKTGAPVKVGKVIEGPEALPLIRFGFDSTAVTTSQTHPVLTGAGLKPANELKKTDTVFDAQGNPHSVTILETLPIEEGQRVINVDLDAASSDADERLIVSDGIITGDIVLQGLLTKERK